MDHLFWKGIENSTQSYVLEEAIQQLQWNSDGLIPVIAQDKHSKVVLMMAWMNQDALHKTLRTGQVYYWSRSRQKLWQKGESSGHTQHLIDCQIDCDGDTLLLQVEQKGPACHTLQPHCFFWTVDGQRIKKLNT
ncbi:MAG: phosphoribosyl-AMP cyclohydrolase [Pseudomonadota bacterium]